MSTTTSSTAAQRLADSPAVAESIETIIRELTEAQSTINGARPPADGTKESYDGWLQRIADTRGRPALYPYVGSGIGHGPLVELADGSVKWDMINGIGVHAFGHSDPDLVATAIRSALGDTVMQGNLQHNGDAIEFTEVLLGQASTTSDLRFCFPTNSGAMANETAIKIAFQKNTPASRLLAFSHCFTGRTMTMAQLTDNPTGRVGLPLSLLVDYVPFYDAADPQGSTRAAVDRLREYLTRYPGQYACFGMELVQGEGGFNVAPPEFFRELMTICREHDVAVWADEVQTFGRTGRMFHYEQLGIGDLIDIVSFGKMSQVCGCLYTEKYNPRPGLLSGTFIGSTVGFQVGRRMFQRLLDGGYYDGDHGEGRNTRLFRTFCEHAKQLVERHPDWFSAVPGLPATAEVGGYFGGIGGMMRFTPFGGEKAPLMKLMRSMFDHGVIAFYCGHGPYHVRFLPPIGVMEPEQFADVFAIVETAMAEVAAG